MNEECGVNKDWFIISNGEIYTNEEFIKEINTKRKIFKTINSVCEHLTSDDVVELARFAEILYHKRQKLAEGLLKEGS